MKKRYLSLSVQILLLCISLVLVLAIAISIIFMVNLNNLTEKSIKTQAEISLKYLNADLKRVLSGFTNMVESGAEIVNTLPRENSEEIFAGMSSIMPDILSLYYGTVVSRHAPDGFYVDSSGWEPVSRLS